MKVMVMTHPINKKCFEVLFSNDEGTKFLTIDGISQHYIEDMMGYNVHSIKHFAKDNPAPYRIMAKCLAEKIMYLKFHVKYKDEYKYLRFFQEIGRRLCDIQTHMEEDLDIPEVVQTLVNTNLEKVSPIPIV